MTTFGSDSRASSSAAGSCAQSSTLLMPTLEPPRAGLTNTGRPEPTRGRLGQVVVPRRAPRRAPIGIPASARNAFMCALSIDAAEAKTPEPT